MGKDLFRDLIYLQGKTLKGGNNEKEGHVFGSIGLFNQYYVCSLGQIMVGSDLFIAIC